MSTLVRAIVRIPFGDAAVHEDGVVIDAHLERERHTERIGHPSDQRGDALVNVRKEYLPSRPIPVRDRALAVSRQAADGTGPQAPSHCNADVRTSRIAP